MLREKRKRGNGTRLNFKPYTFNLEVVPPFVCGFMALAGLGPHNSRKKLTQRKATKMIKGLKNLSYEERLRVREDSG